VAHGTAHKAESDKTNGGLRHAIASTEKRFEESGGQLRKQFNADAELVHEGRKALRKIHRAKNRLMQNRTSRRQPATAGKRQAGSE
jgi:hypothetical protein